MPPEPDNAAEELTDRALQSEIELVGDLVVAATSSAGPLPQEQIARLLGIEPCAGQGGEGNQAPAQPPSVAST